MGGRDLVVRIIGTEGPARAAASGQLDAFDTIRRRATVAVSHEQGRCAGVMIGDRTFPCRRSRQAWTRMMTPPDRERKWVIA